VSLAAHAAVAEEHVANRAINFERDTLTQKTSTQSHSVPLP
jgi:hypothetical protein